MSITPIGEEPSVFRISLGPWLPSEEQALFAHGHRTYLWLHAEFTEVNCNEFGELKRVGDVLEDEGIQWQCFELPKCQDETLKSSQIGYFHLGRWCNIELPELPRLPSRKLLDEVDKLDSAGSDDEASELLVLANFRSAARNGIQIAKLIDRHSDLIYRLTKSVKNIGRYNEFNDRSQFARSVKRIYTRWTRIGNSRIPPLSLVVRLADELPKVLETVCETPRVVLRRQRELELATRIQQVDSACIRWIGRQAGRTLAEKAGPRQRLMGVVRREDYDTPENRVVRDLLCRCKIAGEVYVARHREFASHSRVINVRTFVRLCERLLCSSKIASVGQLVGIAQPNYVLQHESRYSVLWDAYQRLIKQEKETQSTWAWRDRIWNEWLGLGLTSTLAQLSHRSPAMRKSMIIYDEPTAGEFCQMESIGPWWVKNVSVPVAVHMLPQAKVRDCNFLPKPLVSLSPDYVIAKLGPSTKGTAFWTNMDVINASETAKITAEQLQSLMPAPGVFVDWKFVVITGGSKKFEEGSVSETVSWVTLPVMLQDHRDAWEKFVQRAIHHAI